jgi:hypothetical protein
MKQKWVFMQRSFIHTKNVIVRSHSYFSDIYSAEIAILALPALSLEKRVHNERPKFT